ERGTTTTPFDMVMLNDLDRFHLVMDVIDRVDGLATRAAVLRQSMADARLAARRYTREHPEYAILGRHRHNGQRQRRWRRRNLDGGGHQLDRAARTGRHQ
ncbi:MAG TPA: hypothetical protein VL154_01555, partial [Acetobacteraceae bacterium]|nr:hypothetical protein [Acetobacteraceae bacterium]